MKKTVVTCITAFLCVVAVCVSSVLGTNKLADMLRHHQLQTAAAVQTEAAIRVTLHRAILLLHRRLRQTRQQASPTARPQTQITAVRQHRAQAEIQAAALRQTSLHLQSPQLRLKFLAISTHRLIRLRQAPRAA